MIGWNFNILNVLCQIIFPSSTLSETDQWLSVEHKTILYKTIYHNASVVLNVVTDWLALSFISLVNNASVIISNNVTKMVTQKKGNYS